MKKLTGIFTTILALVAIFILASCSNTSNVQVQMSPVITTKSIEMNFTFAANENISNGLAQPHVKKYKYDETKEDGIGEYDNVDMYLLFGNGVYTSSSCKFDQLQMDTKYVFRLYVTFNSQEELIETWTLTTKSGVATDITTKDELLDITNDPSGDYVLKNDIDLEGESIVSLFSDTTSGRFSGTFDGNGHTISNFKFASSNTGLFSYTEGATIKNLTLYGSSDYSIVNGDYANARTSSKCIGSVSGTAKDTLFDNVTVKNAYIKVDGSQSAKLNVGAFVGYAEGCQFVNCVVDDAKVEYKELRNEVCTGLFAGSINGNVKADVTDTSFAVSNCHATGTLEGMLVFSTNSGSVYVGGFAGDISTGALVTDSYVDADINLYRDESSEYNNKFSLSVGGFAGGKVVGTSMYITKCAAVTDILVQAAKKDTTLEEDAILATELNKKFTYIAGFVGEISEFINKIENCVALKKADGIVVKALMSKIDEETGDTITLINKADDIAMKYDGAKLVNLVYANAAADFDTNLLSSTVKTVVDYYLA